MDLNSWNRLEPRDKELIAYKIELPYPHDGMPHQKRAGGSPCLQAWGGSSRPIDTKTTQYVDLQFIDFRYKICYNFSSEKR